MKFKIAITTIITATVLFSILAMRPSSTDEPVVVEDKSIEKAEGNHFVVVELFTSQGCHSCPPADKFLSELVAEDEVNDNQTLFPLSFHVDYWNYLGWKDPYSQAKFSSRQRKYAQQLGSSVYTPQMVFNGVAEAVGSRPQKVLDKLKKVIGNAHQTEINLQAEIGTNDIVVNYSTPEAPKNSVVNIALVEKDLTDQIARGENRGKKLHHDNVVRVFKTEKASSTEEKVKIKFPKDLNFENASIVAFIQNENTFEIYGARQIELR